MQSRPEDSEKNTINCDVGEGVQIPCHIDGLHDFKSPAKYVLIVEKEAIYKRLMEEKLCEKLGPCIILTGKYYFLTWTYFLYRLNANRSFVYGFHRRTLIGNLMCILSTVFQGFSRA